MKIKGLIAGFLAVTVLAGCGDTASVNSHSGAVITTVKLGVVGTVYEELWAPAREVLIEENIKLELIQFSDYVTPNNALANGEIDLNAFQHKIYLDTEIENYGYDIEIVGNTFIIPLNLYSKKVSSVEEITDGATIAIPNDLTNGGRALKVLEGAGLIALSESSNFSPTIDDIEKFNVDIEIIELSANTIPSSLEDVTAAIINGNFALDFGLKTEEAIFKDTSLTEENYWCLVAARSSDLEDAQKVELYKKIIDAYQKDATEELFNNEFGGYFIKAGWGIDYLSR